MIPIYRKLRALNVPAVRAYWMAQRMAGFRTPPTDREIAHWAMMLKGAAIGRI